MKNTKLEMELRQYANTVLFEIEFVKGLKYLERDMTKVLKFSKRQRIDEGLETIVGLWLSGPYIVKLFGKFISYLDEIVKKFNNKGFGGEEMSKKVMEFAEKYHHIVMKVFEWVAGKFTKDEKKKEVIAEWLFYGTVAALLASGTGHIVDSISSSNVDSGIIGKVAKTAIKAKEVYDGVTQGLKSIIPDIINYIKY